MGMSSPPAEEQSPSAPPAYTEQESTQQEVNLPATGDDENAAPKPQSPARSASPDQGYDADTQTPPRQQGEEAQEPWPPLFIDPLLAQAEATEREGGVKVPEVTVTEGGSSAVTATPETPVVAEDAPPPVENPPPPSAAAVPDRPITAGPAPSRLSGSTTVPAYNENDPTTWDPAVIAAITQWATRVSEHPLSSDATVVHHSRPRMVYERPQREPCCEHLRGWCCPCCCCSWLSKGHFEKAANCEFAGEGWVKCVNCCEWITRPCRGEERE